MLREGIAPDDPAADAVESIAKAADRAAGLTRQLLLFSRRHEARRSVVDLNGVVSNVIKMLGRLIGEDVKLETRLSDRDLKVNVDPLQVEQVLMNLAVNARDAMPHGGTLLVEVEPAAGGNVRLAVSDTGVGMDEEIKIRIFEPFFTTKAAGAGTGLGLSTVYAIVQQNGGDVTVHSAPGKGARFEILLPEANADTAAEEPDAVHAPAAGAGTILVVEDDEGVRNLIAAMLSRGGYTVVEAACGEDAFDVLDSGAHVDLLLTDIVMPGMNGWAVAAESLARRPDLKVLYMSGYSEHAQIRREGEPGVTILHKPFTMGALKAAIQSAFDDAQSAGIR
jgi:CheY-like chemotaxis protein